MSVTKKKKIYKKNTICFAAHYNKEIKEIIEQLASIYTIGGRTNVHGFIINCVKTGKMIRTDEMAIENQIRFDKFKHGLETNIPQVHKMIGYIVASKAFFKEFKNPITVGNQTYEPEFAIRGMLKKIEEIMETIRSLQLSYTAETNINYIKLKNRLSTIDRRPKLNKKRLRGIVSNKRIKLEMNKPEYEKLCQKAEEYLSYGSYKNEEDQKLEKPNKSAALIQIICDCEQLISGYPLNEEQLNILFNAGDRFNAEMKEFNTAMKNSLAFKPSEAFNMLQILFKEIKKANIK